MDNSKAKKNKETYKNKLVQVIAYQILPSENDRLVTETNIRNYLSWIKDLALRDKTNAFLAEENNNRAHHFDSSGDYITLKSSHSLAVHKDVIILEFEFHRKFCMPKIILDNRERQLKEGDYLSEPWLCLINTRTGICLLESSTYFTAKRIGIYLINKLGTQIVFKSINNQNKIIELENADCFSYLSCKVATAKSDQKNELQDNIRRMGLMMRADHVRCIFSRKRNSLNKSKFKDYINGVKDTIDENGFIQENFQIKYKARGMKKMEKININRLIYIFEAKIPYPLHSSYSIQLHKRNLENVYQEHYKKIERDVFSEKIDMSNALSDMYGNNN